LFYGVQINRFAFKIGFRKDAFLVLGLHKVGCLIGDKEFASWFGNSEHFAHSKSFIIEKIDTSVVKNNIKHIISKR